MLNNVNPYASNLSAYGTNQHGGKTSARNNAPEQEQASNNPTLQHKRGNARSGVEISISSEARSAVQNKTTVDSSAWNGSGITRDNFAEFADSSLAVDRTPGKLLIMPDDSQQDIYRKELLNSTSLYRNVSDELDSAGKINSLSSKYMELKKGIEEKYSGEEIDEHLKWLDESYDNAVNTIAEHTTFGIKSAAKLYEFSARVNNELVQHGQSHGHTFGIPVKDMIEYDQDAFRQSVNELIQNVQNSIKQYGTLAKQSTLDGNSESLYSLGEIDTLRAIFDRSGGNDSKNALSAALDKLENSGISDDLQAVISRMAKQL